MLFLLQKLLTFLYHHWVLFLSLFLQIICSLQLLLKLSLQHLSRCYNLQFPISLPYCIQLRLDLSLPLLYLLLALADKNEWTVTEPLHGILSSAHPRLVIRVIVGSQYIQSVVGKKLPDLCGNNPVLIFELDFYLKVLSLLNFFLAWWEDFLDSNGSNLTQWNTLEGPIWVALGVDLVLVH